MKYSFTYLVSFFLLLFAGIGAAAQDDIPDWFFEPDKGEFVGVSMPMTNQPKLRHHMALSTALFSEYISVMENPPKGNDNCMISSAGHEEYINNFSDTLHINYHHIVTRTYTNERGEEFIAVKRNHSQETTSESLTIMIMRMSAGTLHYRNNDDANSQRIYREEKLQKLEELNFHWQGSNNDISKIIYSGHQDVIRKYDWYLCSKNRTYIVGESNGPEVYHSQDKDATAIQYIHYLTDCLESPNLFKHRSSKFVSKNQKDSLKLDKSDSLNLEFDKAQFFEKYYKEAMKKFKESNKKN